MDYVINHPDERDMKAEAAKKSIERFDGKKVTKQFEAIYQELLEWKKEGYSVPRPKKEIQP